ncbi:uridine-cytidine kinase-like 1 [Halichondria panicea]|uniref:uridine-cytidine kinase-like 1 n=1 Tax=Halichondria panicea TaxID=6063 RepID=UPI00312B75FF
MSQMPNVLSVSTSGSESGDDENVGELEEQDTFSPPPSPVKSKPVERERIPSEKMKKRRTIYTAGRPPWYNSQGEIMGTFVIGLAGGSASGKTTVACRVIESLKVPWVSLLSMDSFYKVLTPSQHEAAAKNEYNFDHPDSIDFELLIETLAKLKEGKHVEVPFYDFSTHRRAKYTKTMYGANVIIFEGILAFANKELLNLMDLKVFVDTDSDVRLVRRLRRDITERGRELEGVLKLYNKFVKPAFQQYIEPTMQHADIVVPQGAENEVAMRLIVQHIKNQLKKRGFKSRSKLLNGQPNGNKLPESVLILPGKPQVKGMHTVIRNRDTKRDDFVFYTNRLACLLIEHALSLLPFEDCMVESPQGSQYMGKTFRGKVCGVSILRAGEVLEPALLSVCKDATLGKILIQTNPNTGEPELHFLRLPSNIAEFHVVLMDATIATGAAAIMAIRILLDHDVKEENIMFVSILASRLGAHSVAYAFPRVNIVTSAIDEQVNENFYILPGVGNYGDRYFGTGLD